MTPIRSLTAIGAFAIAAGLCGWILLNSTPARLDRPALILPLTAATAYADQTISFFDTAIGGDDFVWCIDRSCSTGWDEDLATMKVEVVNAIEQLSPTSRFSVVSFNSSTRVWISNLEDATSAAIDSATAFINGLVSSGSTCMLDGLGIALDIAEQSTGEASVILVADGPNFCTGTPSSGTPPDQLAIMVNNINPQSIPIHGFHVSADASWGVETLQAIAAATGGIFVDTDNPGPTTGSAPFIRGDVNADGIVDISDGVVALAWLFRGEVVECVDSLDANDDGSADISDVVYILQHLFSPSGVTPPAPFPTCGLDLTCDSLDCLSPSAACP
ncbi:MAG: VWA domain-containing protein [Planctomycetota bacterium]